MRYFIDTEHTDDGRHFELISIAIVADDGREYYAAVEGYDASAMTPWIEQHVLPKLPPAGDPLWKPRHIIRRDIAAFVTGEPIEFWSMCAWVDWSLLVRLFGNFNHTPQGWPMACWDLWQLEAQLGLTMDHRPPVPDDLHNALVDARYHRQIYHSLQEEWAKLAAAPVAEP